MDNINDYETYTQKMTHQIQVEVTNKLDEAIFMQVQDIVMNDPDLGHVIGTKYTLNKEFILEIFKRGLESYNKDHPEFDK